MSKAVVNMTLADAGHYTPEQAAARMAEFPKHERDARAKGIPMMGSGLIFPFAEEDITVRPFVIPPHWSQINGLDFGYDHPFGATNLAWDRDADCIYVCKEYRQREASPVTHSAAIKPWGAWIPCAWPHDGLQHDKGSCEQLAKQYRAQGLNMLPDRATFDDGTNSVEAGVLDMFERMETGRWKVFDTCQSWLEERRMYHRADGKIVKQRDDLISSSRYALMMKRSARVRPVKRDLEIPDYGIARGRHG